MLMRNVLSDILVEILKLKLGRDLELCLLARDLQLEKILKVKFGRDFEAEVWSRF